MKVVLSILFASVLVLFAEEISLSSDESAESTEITITDDGVAESRDTENDGSPESPPKKVKPEIIEKGDVALRKKGYSVAAGMYAGGMDPSEGFKIRKEIELRKRAISAPVKKVPPLTRKVTYDGKSVIFLNTLRDHATVINFYDESGNFADIEYATAGSDYFRISKLTSHTIEIKPVDTYRGGNLIVGISVGGEKTQVVFELSESLGETGYDAVVDVMVRGSEIKSGKVEDEEGYKYAIIKEVTKYGALEGAPETDYEVYSLSKSCKPVLFSRNKLKIYSIEKFGRKYYVVLLHKDFVVYGYPDSFALARYENDYLVYIMDYNVSTFAIRTNPRYDLRRSDVERYRIVIKF